MSHAKAALPNICFHGIFVNRARTIDDVVQLKNPEMTFRKIPLKRKPVHGFGLQAIFECFNFKNRLTTQFFVCLFVFLFLSRVYYLLFIC